VAIEEMNMRYPKGLFDRARPSFPIAIALAALSFVGTGVRATDLQEITVTVPTVTAVGRDASGAPIQQVSASARIQYDPMMLTTHSGRALLKDRVTEVARRLCREVNNAVPPAGDEESCVQQAVHGAKVQIAAAAVAQKAG
jgi:UrcA family protein